jgi:UrcA family protein
MLSSVEMDETARTNIDRRHAMTRQLALAALGTVVTVALLASPVSASAAQPSAVRAQTQVHYDLRELSSERGIRSLYRRIVRAAREVCPQSTAREGDVNAESAACRRRAIVRAIAEIGNERLAALDAAVGSYVE